VKRLPLAARIIAEIIFRERLPGEEQAEVVQFQMPERLYRLFQIEARRQGSDLNTLVRDVVCTALTERADAIRRIDAAGDGQHAD
jgi:hypothetical protein